MVSPYAGAPKIEEKDVRKIVSGDFVEIEIGPGRGMFLLERAIAEPRAGLIGLEIRRKWAAIVDARLAKLGHAKRARVFAEDARDALPGLVPDRSVRRFFVHFPDPWWKKRHQKRLVVGDVLLREIIRLLEPGGELFVQTDVDERANAYQKHIELTGKFAGGRVTENPYGARSNREKRAIADGLPIHRLLYRLNL
jgi:tRNA (guanine-N7-)-methyltransferase